MANYIDKLKIQETPYELHDARISDVDSIPTLDSSVNTVTSHGIFTAMGAIESKYAPAKDLSLYDIQGNKTRGRNTANTYVVAQSGKYIFPLVYGNGITNGSNNTAAYTRMADSKTEIISGSEYPTPITSPFIDKNLHLGEKVGSANYTPELLWQTDPNFIISLDVIEKEDTYYIQFQVNALPETNAIAHIAVTDVSLGHIVWSWMIWGVAQLTDLEEMTVTNKTGVNYTMLKTPLGAIWDSPRGYYVTPYYQWGRKDPMYPLSNVDFSSTIALYNINAELISNVIKVQPAARFENSVRNPDTLYLEDGSNPGKWCILDNLRPEYCNFWDNENTIDASTPYAGLIDNKDTAVKTIYDPCPTGYMVPTALWTTGFCGDDYEVRSYTADTDPTKIVGEWSNGYYYKRYDNDPVGWKICPNGYREGSRMADIVQAPTSGNYWMSGVCAADATSVSTRLSSWKFTFNDSTTGPHIATKYSMALGIIPMKDSNR